MDDTQEKQKDIRTSVILGMVLIGAFALLFITLYFVLSLRGTGLILDFFLNLATEFGGSIIFALVVIVWFLIKEIISNRSSPDRNEIKQKGQEVAILAGIIFVFVLIAVMLVRELNSEESMQSLIVNIVTELLGAILVTFIIDRGIVQFK